MADPTPTPVISDTGRPVFRKPLTPTALIDKSEASTDADRFRAKIDNFPVVVSKNYERLGGESKSGEEGEEG
jgi:hypothetical protein